MAIPAGHPQRERRGDRALPGRHLLDRVPLVAQGLRQRSPGADTQPQEPQRGPHGALFPVGQVVHD